MKRLFCLALCICLLTGCAAAAPGASVTPAAPADPAAPAAPVQPQLQEAAKLISPMGAENSAAVVAATGANDFAFRLSAALLAEQSDTASLVCSPYSVWLPLAALLNATDAPAQPALLEALGAAGISAADVNRAASRMLYSLTNQQEKDWIEENLSAAASGKEQGEWEYEVHDPLAIANAIFVDRAVTLNADFAQRFLDNFRGTAMPVDFSDPSAVKAVNDWANEQTKGLIPEIVQAFDPETVAAIANAIYFSDRWHMEFDEAQTKQDIFHGKNGDANGHFMLREGDDLPYFEDERMQAMQLPFLSGGGMLIMLPKDGDASALLAAMTNDRYNEIFTQGVRATGKLLLPRFSLSSELQLNDALTALGVNLFDAENPVLTGLVEETSAFLTSAVQKAVIEVDEKGTTAAAVTVMAATGVALPAPTEPFSMVCDRPFAFILYGNTYDGGNQVLFTGVVNDLA